MGALTTVLNFILRGRFDTYEKRIVKLPWSDEDVKVLTVAPIEIFASKTVALLSRSAPRDFYDLHNMIHYDGIGEDNRELFKKCVVFYSAISMERPPEKFVLDNIGNITKMQIKRDLDPDLRKGERLKLEFVREQVKTFLNDILIATEDE